MRPPCAAKSSSALCHHIGRVLGGCSQEQVIRPHANGVVARVADKHAVRDRAIGQLPRHAVRADRAAVLRGSAIPSRPSRTLPGPAPRTLPNIGPETIRYRDRHPGLLAGIRTVLALPIADGRRPLLEGRSALTADALNGLAAGVVSAWTGAVLREPALDGLSRGDKGAAALVTGTMYGHRAYSSVSGLGRLQPRRGHFASRFYHACRRAFAPIVDAAEMERSA